MEDIIDIIIKITKEQKTWAIVMLFLIGLHFTAHYNSYLTAQLIKSIEFNDTIITFTSRYLINMIWGLYVFSVTIYLLNRIYAAFSTQTSTFMGNGLIKWSATALKIMMSILPIEYFLLIYQHYRQDTVAFFNAVMGPYGNFLIPFTVLAGASIMLIEFKNIR